MDSSSKDVLFTIAMNLELPALLNWCKSNSRINRDVCQNEHVWRNKLLREYPDYGKFKLNRSLREIYVFMYQLSLIKKLLNTDKSLYDIFLMKELNLSSKELTKVPAFDLPNLEALMLGNNKLTQIPSFNLPKLKILYVDINILTNISPLNLPDVEIVSLTNNKLTKIPKLYLPKLKNIYLGGNKFSEEEKSSIKEEFKNKVSIE
jgi:Leucine-rich repeat (LRR) protein